MLSWSRRTTIIATAVAALSAATAAKTAAGPAEPDGVHLHGQWISGGGEAWLELEDRNVVPAVCFIWHNDLPQDGDGIASRILTRSGTEVVDLGVADQWIEGGAEGCELMEDESFRAVFANPGQYVVEVRVVEEQGTPATPRLVSGPLEARQGA